MPHPSYCSVGIALVLYPAQVGPLKMFVLCRPMSRFMSDAQGATRCVTTKGSGKQLGSTRGLRKEGKA